MWSTRGHKKMILDHRVSCFVCFLHVHFPFLIQQQNDGITLNSHISINLWFLGMLVRHICWLLDIGRSGKYCMILYFCLPQACWLACLKHPVYGLQCLPTLDTPRAKKVHFHFWFLHWACIYLTRQPTQQLKAKRFFALRLLMQSSPLLWCSWQWWGLHQCS